MIDRDPAVFSIRRQCELIGLSRSSLYYQPAGESEYNLGLMHMLDLATLLVFDIQHDPSYDMPGCIVDEQCLPRPSTVHLILADPWSKEWANLTLGHVRSQNPFCAEEIKRCLK